MEEKEISIQYAIIKETSLGFIRGNNKILSFNITFEFADGHRQACGTWYEGIPNLNHKYSHIQEIKDNNSYPIEGILFEMIAGLLADLGVDTWEELIGKTVRVKREDKQHAKLYITEIGNYNLKEEFVFHSWARSREIKY